MRPADALGQHRDELVQLLRDHGVTSAVIFGSTATGTDTELSDLDIAVRFEERPRGFAYYGALADLEAHASRLVGVRVDLGMAGGNDWSSTIVLF